MSCSTPGEDVFTETGEKPQKDGSGLVAGHAYTLLAAKETSQGHNLVCLRNPWGNFEWQGAWSDHSDLWTPALRAEMDADQAEDDGKFWMCFEVRRGITPPRFLPSCDNPSPLPAVVG